MQLASFPDFPTFPFSVLSVTKSWGKSGDEVMIRCEWMKMQLEILMCSDSSMRRFLIQRVILTNTHNTCMAFGRLTIVGVPTVLICTKHPFSVMLESEHLPQAYVQYCSLLNVRVTIFRELNFRFRGHPRKFITGFIEKIYRARRQDGWMSTEELCVFVLSRLS